MPEKIERERKFLVKRLPQDLERYPHQEIVQGYIVITDSTEVRLRQANNQFMLTIKRGEGLQRNEFETDITKDEFSSLWPATEGKRLEKTRYKIPLGDLTIELDLYKADLSGLVLVEVEFDSVEESDKFTPPAWFGQEVTIDKRYKNQTLATEGLPTNPK